MLKLTKQLNIATNISTITKHILNDWNHYFDSSININIINTIPDKTIDFIKKKYKNIIKYLEYGHLLEWLNKGIDTYYSIIILFTLFSRCIYYDTRNMYKNDEKIFLFMEMGIDFYNIKFSDNTLYEKKINSNKNLLKKYIILLPFQIIENILYQVQGTEIIYRYIIKANNIKYKQLLRKILHYQKERIFLLETFNRFPNRNRILNREPTIYEIDYIDEQNYLN
tara:strand:+ start:201 stop:872 length:672 start_codon:yes stop_codon:yes gene_type:complete